MVSLRKQGGGGGGTPDTALLITSFTHNSGSHEKGETVDDFKLSWTYNTPTHPLTQQTLDHGIGDVLPLTKLDYDVTGAGLTTNETYELTATNGTDTPTDTTTIYFYNKRHWGPDASATLDSAGILTLTGSEFSTSRLQTKNFDCSGGKYIWFAWPTSFGQGTFYVNGFLTTFVEDTVSHTNASGHTENYYTYRSYYIQNGSSINVQVT